MARLQSSEKFGTPMFRSVRFCAHHLDEWPAATYDRIRRREIQAVRVGRKIRVREIDWQKFLAEYVTPVNPDEVVDGNGDE